jgi:hypothetical protein
MLLAVSSGHGGIRRRSQAQRAVRRKGVDFVFPGLGGVYQGWGHSKARLDAAIQASCGVGSAGHTAAPY